MPKVARVEIWDDFQCAGGVRLGVVPDVLAISDVRRLAGDDALTLRMPIGSVAWEHATDDAVLRVTFTDGSIDEWRITTIAESNGADGQLAMLTAAAPLLELAAAMIARTEADGTVVHDFEALQLSPAEHLASFVLPALAAEGITWIAAGTIEPTDPVDVVYDWDSPLAVCRRLAEAAECELQLRRNGTAGYLIDLVAQVNSGAATADIRLGKNLQGITRTRETSEQRTRIYPRGVELDGIRATMAHAQWRVAAIAGTTVTLADPGGGDGPIAFDDQLNGRYVRTVGGALREITDSAEAAQQVVLASVAGVAVNDRIEIRKNAAGDWLTHLDRPGARVIPGALDRPDLPETTNVVANPVLRAWAGAASDPPDSWTKVGTPTLARTTTATRWQTGARSCRVQSTADGQGIESAYATIAPSTARPYASGFIGFWLESGRVRVELWATDGVTTWRLPDGTDGLAYSTETGTWVLLGVSGLDVKALGLGVTQVKIRIVQDGAGTADFYVDAGQITQTAGQEPLFEGAGGTALWQAANAELRRVSDPLVRYDIDVLDLARARPDVWPDDVLVIGGPVRVTDHALGIVGSTRVLELQRDLLRAGDTKVVLSNRPEDLTDALVRPRRAPRKLGSPETATLLSVQAHFTPVAKSPTTQLVKLSARPAEARVFYIVQDAGATVPVIGSSSWTEYSASFAVTQSETVDQQVAAYAQLGGRYSRVELWTIPQLANPLVAVTLGENPTGTLTISWTPAGDVVYVDLYRKKNGAGNGWPTTNNNSDGPLDRAQYLGRFHVEPDGGGWDASGTAVAGRTSMTEAGYAASDVAKIIAVPTNKDGTVGARTAVSRTMTGVTALLTAFTATLASNGTDCVTTGQVTINWTPNAGVSDGTHDLNLYRSRDGAPRVLVGTVTTPASSGSTSVPIDTFVIGGTPNTAYTFSYDLVAGASVVDTGSAAALNLGVGECPIG